MRKGFTMIELIFVIVILGILAAVAIPKLAATRSDAKAASIKTDIGTAEQAIPAWFQGQKEASFLHAMSLDTGVWSKTNNKCEYIYTDDVGDTVSMGIHNENNASAITNCDVDANTTTNPVLVIDLTQGGAGIVKRLDDMGVKDINISLGGKKVKF